MHAEAFFTFDWPGFCWSYFQQISSVILFWMCRLGQIVPPFFVFITSFLCTTHTIQWIPLHSNHATKRPEWSLLHSHYMCEIIIFFCFCILGLTVQSCAKLLQRCQSQCFFFQTFHFYFCIMFLQAISCFGLHLSCFPVWPCVSASALAPRLALGRLGSELASVGVAYATSRSGRSMV